MPYYTVQSDSEEPDYGEVVMDYWSGYEFSSVQIVRTDSRNTVHILTLRKRRGNVPGKFRRLQKQNDRRVKEIWFQCEPCAALA